MRDNKLYSEAFSEATNGIFSLMKFDEKSLFTFASSLICFFAALFTMVGFCISAHDNNKHTKKTGLFRDATVTNEIGKTREPFIVRTRFVEINFKALIRKDVSYETKSYVSKTLILNLFENVCFTAILDRLELRTISDFSWIGHIEGTEHSEVILILKDRIMVGNITIPFDRYQVRYVKNGTHAILEINQSGFPQELEPVPVE